MAAAPTLQTSHSEESVYYSQSGQSSQKSPSPQPQHRRGYQACDPCRKRKVKCDLGSVDNPRPPPCVRCRRESKRCEFSATRRKRKRSEPAEESVDSVLRRDKRMMIGEMPSTSSEPPTSTASPLSKSPLETRIAPYDARPNPNPTQPGRTWSEGSPPGGPLSIHRSHSNPRIGADTSSATSHIADFRMRMPPGPSPGDRRMGTSYILERGQAMMNRTAVELLSPAISNSHDALHLLSEAAGRSEDLNRYAARHSVSSFASPVSSMNHVQTPKSLAGTLSRPARSPGAGMNSIGSYFQNGSSHPAEPRSRVSREGSSSSQEPGFLEAVKAWSRLRFVRAGWLTVEEAMAYVAYYYEHLAPLSPIVIPDFSSPSTHRMLLTDEPVLAVTILTVASRHLKLKGDGANSRSFYIHDRLWSYLRGMIERLFWGQEKFGGSGIGISKPRSLDIAAMASKGPVSGNLRSLGTVEALLILTDWHPRNLHFPPGDDENALLDLDAHIPVQNRSEKDLDTDHELQANRGSSGASEGRLAFQKWLEPAWRSDRMSWMLLSTAQALAFELGVFDGKCESRTANESPAEQTRKRRLRRLILVYITQSSGRLGIPSMLPLPQWSHETQPTTINDVKSGDANVDRMQDLWIGISKVMYQSNQLLFASNEQTSELIRSGRYREQIDRFLPFLRDWRDNIDSATLGAPMRSILMMEYEYTRLYVNSLALQAVVDRWTTMSNEAANTQAQSGRAGSGSTSSSSWFRALMEIYRVNEPYIQEVVDASRRILMIVLESLVPGDHLKHAPVRTCFRILSGMIFLLKTFTLGAKEDDVRVSLDLQDRTIEALRTCVVDDVHLSHTIARLLELLTNSIRTRFLRFAPLDRGGDGDAHDGRPSAPTSRQQSPHPQSRREFSGPHWQQSHGGNNATAPNMGYMDGHNSHNSMHDPLAGIPAQPINSSNLNVSFMPPPPSVYYNYYDPNSASPIKTEIDGTPVTSQGMGDAPGGATSSAALPDWFALPLDQFFNSSTTVVDQGLGGTGPMLGEFDMLEVLLNEQYDGSGEAVDASGGGLGQQFLQSP